MRDFDDYERESGRHRGADACYAEGETGKWSEQSRNKDEESGHSKGCPRHFSRGECDGGDSPIAK